jgi:hypothetical protein
MSKTFRAWKIDAALLLRHDAQPTIQVRDLQCGIRVGVWPEQRRRMRIQRAGAVGIVLAGSAFGLHQYAVWRSNSLGPQLQAWAQPGSDTPQLEVDASWQLSQSTRERAARNEADAKLGSVKSETRLVPASSPSPSADSVPSHALDPPPTAAPQQKPTSSEPLGEWVAQPGLDTLHLEDLTRERPARSWQRVRLRFSSRATRKKEVVAQLGPVEPATRLAPASSLTPSPDPVSNPALDPPLTGAPQQKPTSSEPLGEWVTTVSAIDQGVAPISARGSQTKPQPQRDRSVHKQIDTRDQGSMTNVIGNINDGLRKAWSSVQVWK